jgi:uncharacterized SAM-binding protein YcdF (DUF218 family)
MDATSYQRRDKIDVKKFLLFILALIVVFYFFAGQILTAYANLFRIDNATKGADVILILGGNAKTRPFHAAKLFNEGYAKTILQTQPRHYKKEIAHIIPYEGVYVEQILSDQNISVTTVASSKGGATSTFDEARDLARYVKKNKIKHMILVTDAFHTARTYYAFNKIFALEEVEIKLEISAAPNDIFNESNWYTTEKGVSAYILEPIKFLFYLFSNQNTTLVKEH